VVSSSINKEFVSMSCTLNLSRFSIGMEFNNLLVFGGSNGSALDSNKLVGMHK
jgi:hypothetical protein